MVVVLEMMVLTGWGTGSNKVESGGVLRVLRYSYLKVLCLRSSTGFYGEALA